MRPLRLACRVLLACTGALSALACAAEYPERPVRLIISSAVGGSPDIVTRILAAELVKQMGQRRFQRR